MSFCNDLKIQLAAVKTPRRVKLPLMYGLLLFGRAYSYKRIGLQTASEAAAELYSELLYECFKAKGEKAVGGELRKIYCVNVPSDTDRLKILASLDFGMHSGAINRAVTEIAGGEAAFIRGAFLACGGVNDPERGYRADFSVKSEQLAAELEELLIGNGVPARTAKRAGAFSVYVSSSEGIINLLTLLGATERSLELIEATILKGVKNNMNRARNCDNANISKTVEASIAQRRAISYLENSGRLQTLEPPLYAAAVLRRDNPELSLKQLCRLSPEPITASGLNHRLQKIIELANELIEGGKRK